MTKKHSKFYWAYLIVTLFLIISCIVLSAIGLIIATNSGGGNDSDTVTESALCAVYEEAEAEQWL